jgi:hypothetical protein
LPFADANRARESAIGNRLRKQENACLAKRWVKGAIAD